MNQQSFILETGKIYAYNGKVYGGPGKLTRSYEKIGNYVRAPRSDVCALSLSFDLGIPGSDKKPIELPEYNTMGIDELILKLALRSAKRSTYSKPKPTPKKPFREEKFKGVKFITKGKTLNFFTGEDGKMYASSPDDTHKGTCEHCNNEKKLGKQNCGCFTLCIDCYSKYDWGKDDKYTVVVEKKKYKKKYNAYVDVLIRYGKCLKCKLAFTDITF